MPTAAPASLDQPIRRFAPFIPRVEQCENDVEYNCIEWLMRKQWIPDRIHVGVFYTRDRRPIHIGRPGDPDWRFMRGRQFCMIEMKAPGRKPEKRQLERIAVLQALGVLVTWVDGLQSLQAWYAAERLDEQWQSDEQRSEKQLTE